MRHRDCEHTTPAPEALIYTREDAAWLRRQIAPGRGWLTGVLLYGTIVLYLLQLVGWWLLITSLAPAALHAVF